MNDLAAHPALQSTAAPPALDGLRIALIGLGYVGAPLAAAFARHWPTVGFDINAPRVEALRAGDDRTGELEPQAFAALSNLTLSTQPSSIAGCNVFIITVPTPVDAAKRPDMGAMISASRMVASVLQPGHVVIYESTVYPGATEEVCVPILEEISGLTFNRDFFVGYSPERINPGDTEHRLETILKVTSGSNAEAAEFVDALYRRIITAGTHKASSIRVAEAAKVIENTQRDLNIALVNELAVLFHKLGIDTTEVLAAAGTKWNFLPFKPGLVGGHCIGVDPYYLTYKAQQVGYHPDVILAGRRINDAMGGHVATRVVKLMAQRGIELIGARVLVLGLSFKPDCPDVRNTKVVDVVERLREFQLQVDVHDAHVDAALAHEEYGLALIEQPALQQYDAVVLAVGHRDYLQRGAAWARSFGKPAHVLFDVSQKLPRTDVDDRL